MTDKPNLVLIPDKMIWSGSLIQRKGLALL
jgi:hypothetical protein